MNTDITLRHHEDDIQAIVATGFVKLRWSRFYLLHVSDAEKARDWILARLTGGLIKSVASLGWDAELADRDVRQEGVGPRGGKSNTGKTTKHDVQAENKKDALALAFTFAGLCKLGLQEAENLPFPAIFKRGMGDSTRAPLFGDNLDDWKWADRADLKDKEGNGIPAVHMLVMYYSERAQSSPPFLVGSALHDAGLELAKEEIIGCPSYIDTDGAAFEPFGFRDGIAQPVIRGLRESTSVKAARRSAGPLFEDRVVAPGEFILGHTNEYGERALYPDVLGRPKDLPPFGFNGSYLVARQITQDVETFITWENDQKTLAAKSNGAAAVSSYSLTNTSGEPSPGEKLIGRRRTGESLLCPFTGNSDPTKDLDAFRYRVEDAVGFLCPRGAHVRRANPRDLLGWDVESGVAASKLHRIIRRGRVVAKLKCGTTSPGVCGDSTFREIGKDMKPCGTGLMFIALNADLERQYEFIQQNWIVNKKFGDLVNERDPIVGGEYKDEQREFSVPDDPAGKKLKLPTDFTKVVGGGYFFLPSLTALRLISEGIA